MPTCLITGATGFIGTHAIRDLTGAGWTVHAIARDTTRIVGPAIRHPDDGSIGCLRAALTASRPDAVIHLATCYIKDHRPEDISGLITANITFGTNLLEAMWGCGCRRLVTAGTAWQHLDQSDDGYRPATLYAATKQAFEDIAQWYALARGVAVTALHLGDTYGPADPRPKIFSLLARAALTGEPLELSPGGQRLDPLFVSDATSALDVAANRTDSGFQVYRVAPGRPLTLRKLVEHWCDINASRPDLRWGAKPYRQQEVMEPWSGGIMLPGWQADVDIREGLARCRDAGSQP